MSSQAWTSLALSVLLLCALATNAEARPRPAASTAKAFEANKEFGLGLMLGNPSGLSGKYYLGVDTALDFGVGGYFGGYHHHGGLHLHADFLWHPVVLAQADPFWLPLYFGIGGRALFAGEYRHGDHSHDGHSHLGVRAPLGIAMDFNRVPLDIFFELALVIDFATESTHHDYVDLSGAIGARYYF